MSFAKIESARLLTIVVKSAESARIGATIRFDHVRLKMNNFTKKASFLSFDETRFLYAKLVAEAPWKSINKYSPEEGYYNSPNLFCIASQQGGLFEKPPEWVNELLLAVNSACERDYNFLFFMYHKMKNNFSLHQLPANITPKSFALLTIGAKRTISFKQNAAFEATNGDLILCNNEVFFSIDRSENTNSSQITVLFQELSTVENLSFYNNLCFLRNQKNELHSH
jgi:hypothetical protein